MAHGFFENQLVLQDDLRAILKGFYSNLKNCDQYIEFAMLTGVSRFGKLSIFSDLNNLNDISLSEEYSAICGITVEEIKANFSDGVRELAERNGISIDEAYARLKENYDGYHFSPYSPDIYNPFSLMSALKTLRIEDYGFSSDIPTSLVDMIRSIKAELQDPENLEEDIDNLMNGSFYMGNILSLMYLIKVGASFDDTIRSISAWLV